MWEGPGNEASGGVGVWRGGCVAGWVWRVIIVKRVWVYMCVVGYVEEVRTLAGGRDRVGD